MDEERRKRGDEPEETNVHKAGRTDQPEHEGPDTGAMPEGGPGEDVGMEEPTEEFGEGGRRTDEAGTPTGDRERDPDRPADAAPGRED